MPKSAFDIVMHRRTGEASTVEMEPVTTFTAKGAAKRAFLDRVAFWITDRDVCVSLIRRHPNANAGTGIVLASKSALAQHVELNHGWFQES
jgi:hypothetical protein